MPKNHKPNDPWYVGLAGGPGHVPLDRQVRGLQAVTEAAPLTVLDLGCAEGLVGMHVLTAGPRRIGQRVYHGVELVPDRIAAGRELFARREQGIIARFFHADLDDFDEWADRHRSDLLPQYDVVLALAIAQKLPRPAGFLRAAARLARRVLAVRTPHRVICDPRSGSRVVDTVRVLAEEDLRLVQESDGYPADPSRVDPLGEAWLGLFARTS